ncbi:hypothetical protein [Nocardia cyriacigeorgica]|jgi:hypothetical protein|uniref:hypothetical protein n=1 Tax=Nocardia cyriacigeorgica TaxID=135487 RepID=UPI000CE9B6E7|nr:hypothetical protein [Nocardia cyriacigeorgica]AVH21323.1 hypothetical protein C5B73_07425 [Nocardia cyriacigeorgica]MBF6324487.1 hypothetical protein [Nocardia cyriacigeorgica]PPJ06807.1 hypothetical protein C5E43_19600 [Nocardia cyriacigeorgica]
MSRNLVFQLYSTPEQAEETHSALAREVAKVPELALVRLEFEQDAGGGFDMHLTWAQQHPNQDAADRGYYYLRVESPTELPDRVLEGVEERSGTGSTRPTTPTPTRSSRCERPA